MLFEGGIIIYSDKLKGGLIGYGIFGDGAGKLIYGLKIGGYKPFKFGWNKG